jgi:hypothetical protein
MRHKTLPAHWRLALAATLVVVVSVAASLALGALAASGGPPSATPATAGARVTAEKGGTAAKMLGWPDIERLIGEQKLEAAAAAVEKIRLAAQRRGDQVEWARALVKQTQLRIALGGWETAVRSLKEAPWPKAAQESAVLELFYAHSLVTYLDSYSWEIGQREKVETRGAVDLKAWTREEIVAAAQRAYVEVWKLRDQLGVEPVSRLAEYLDANGYPADVRGTLRDAVSYLFVELLANTSHWRAEQENELYTLDLAALVKGGSAASGVVALDDPAVHPLIRIGAVLDDLEAWHAARGERAAALEARLERSRRLFASFSGADDRRVIRGDLAVRLPGLHDVSWWAEGMAQLAEFTRADAAPDALVRARAIAAQGLAAFPDSPGGRHCRNTVTTIEAPDYRVQAMTGDAPGRRSIEVTHANLPALHFRAYAMDLVKRLESSHDYNLLPASDEVRAFVHAHTPVATWRVSLPPTPDFRQHRTFVTPPALQRGFYLIVSSARADFAAADNRLLATPMSIGDLVLISRQDDRGGAEARVVSGDTGAPLAGVEVELWEYDWKTKHHRVDSATTGGDGLVYFPPAGDRASANFFLLARTGDDLALDARYLSLYHRSQPEETSASLVFTDRSIYRPLQKLSWKVLAYHGRADQARFNTLPAAPVTVWLTDPNGQTVASSTVTTNTFGSASGEFTIPAGRLLGQWRLATSLGGGAQVRVEEYKRPTFEATFADPKTPLRLNKQATLAGEARYYFGLPVASGSVRWRVSREPVYPWWWWNAPRTQAQVIASGTAGLADDGRFEIVFTPAADERLATTSRDVTYAYAVTADITDEGGETRTATRSFRLGFVSVEARVDLPRAFFRPDEPALVTIMRTSLDGVPRPGAGRWRLAELQQPAKTLLPAEEPVPGEPHAGDDQATPYRTPGDLLKPRWDTAYDLRATLRSWPEGADRVPRPTRRGEARSRPPPSRCLPAHLPHHRRLRRDRPDRHGLYRRLGRHTPGGPGGARGRGLLCAGRRDGQVAGHVGHRGSGDVPRHLPRRRPG